MGEVVDLASAELEEILTDRAHSHKEKQGHHYEGPRRGGRGGGREIFGWTDEVTGCLI